MKKAIICYLSFSGNTEEVADLIKDTLIYNNYQVDMYKVGYGLIPDLSSYDLRFFGTFTWGRGAVPEDMKDFIWELGYKPSNVFIFGTGDTQFGGDDLFCKAADKLAEFYHSTYKPLKIEQSPRGYQEKQVIKWTQEVINICQKN